MGKVNRYTQTSNPRFDPMSLQELMMAPAYKRQQHDTMSESIAETETQLAQVDPLDLHSDVAKQEQQRLYDQLSKQSELLNKDGFTSTTKSDVLRLNKDYQSSIGPTGIIGKVNAAKTSLNKERDIYISNATKTGYSPEQAGMRWQEHVANYAKEFDTTDKITNIGSLYAPKYHDVVAEAKELFKNAGFSQETLRNDLGTSHIVKDKKGQYVVTTKGYEKYGSNAERLQDALDYMNNQINNTDSEVYQSLIHQGKTQESALKEIEGLGDVFIKTNRDIGSGRAISNFSPTKVDNDKSTGSTFLHSMVKGVNSSSIDPNSPLIALGNLEGVDYDSKGNIVAAEDGYKTYDDKVKAVKEKIPTGSNLPKGEESVRYNKDTGLYEERSINRNGFSLGSSYKWTPILKDSNHYKETLNTLRTENPYLRDLSDSDLMNRLQTFKEDLSSNYVGAITPVGANFGWMNDKLFGSQSGAGEKSTGTLSQTGVTIDGSKYTSDQLLSEFGYSNMQNFKDNGSPSIEEYVPAMGKWRSTAYDSKGNQRDFFTEAPEQINSLVNKTRIGYNALLAGKSFEPLGTVNTANFKGYMYLTNDFINPQVVFSNKKVNSLKELEGVEAQSMDYKAFTQLEIESLRSSNIFNALSGIDKTNK